MEVTPGTEAGLLGMRGILNRPYRLTARFAEAAIFRQPYPAIARATMTPAIHLLWAASWSGLAAASLDKARGFLARQGTAEPGVAEVLAAEFSRLVDRHYALNALIRDAVRAFDEGADGLGIGLRETARAKRLKTQASALLQEICLGALGLIGMPAYSETDPASLSQIIRDALSAPVMISNHRLVLANAPVERFIEEAP
jgi:acyl-CoA dehydrogenase